MSDRARVEEFLKLLNEKTEGEIREEIRSSRGTRAGSYIQALLSLSSAELRKAPCVILPEARLLFPDPKDLEPARAFAVLSLYHLRLRRMSSRMRTLASGDWSHAILREYDIRRQFFMTEEMIETFDEVTSAKGENSRNLKKRLIEELRELAEIELKRLEKEIQRVSPSRLKKLNLAERDFYCLASVGSSLIEDDTWVPDVYSNNFQEVHQIRTELSKIHGNQAVLEISRPDSRLFRDGVIEVEYDQLFHTEWERVDVRVPGFKASKTLRRMRPKNSSLTLMNPKAGFEEVILPEAVKTDLQALCREYERRIREGRKARLTLYFEGAPGTGKTLTAQAVAHALGMQVMRILVTQAKVNFLPNILGYFGPQASRKQSVLLFDEADDLLSPNPFTGVSDSWVKTAFEDFEGIAVFTSNRPIGEAIKRRMTYCVEFKRPGPEARFPMYWNEIRNACEEAKIADFPDESEVRRLARTFTLPAGYLAQSIQLAIARSPEGMLTVPELERALLQRESMVQGPESDEDRIPLVNLDQVKLKPESREEIERFARFAETLFSPNREEFPGMPKGATILFTGSPGTGKTLTAEAIASRLGRPFRRISPSSLLSPFVGGTEQNIRKVFREAESSGSVLMIDEAEGLFADRGGAQRNWEVTQANELLQQVEGFRGVLVIATNHSERMDPAFTRRFIFRVHLERPDADTRFELWKHWQSHLAVQEADLRLLSVRYELSGGEIRNIAVRALARGESSLAVLEAECQSELRNRTGRASRALGI